jgi:hypothetical protein
MVTTKFRATTRTRTPMVLLAVGLSAALAACGTSAGPTGTGAAASSTTSGGSTPSSSSSSSSSSSASSSASSGGLTEIPDETAGPR